MSTSIKFILSLVLIIVLSYFGYKQTHIDNSEEVYVEPTTNIVKQKALKERTVHNDYLNHFDSSENTVTNTKENHQKQVKQALNMSMMYDTPEKLMKAIIYYQENNQEDKADEFIDYLLEKYPDYQMDN